MEPKNGRPLVYTPEEAARLLKVSSSTVRKMVKAGGLASVAGLGSSIRIPSRAVFELVGETPPSISEGLGAQGTPADEDDEEPQAAARLPRSITPYAPSTRFGPRHSRVSNRVAPKPRAPIRVGDQGYWLLGDSAKYRLMTWHIGIEAAMCGRKPEGKWSKSEGRAPYATLCPICLTTVSQMPGIAFETLPIRSTIAMVRQMKRGEGVALRKAGWHTGNGRRTNCGKEEGPWHLTERFPDRAQECFECREYGDWLAERNPSSLSYQSRESARWSMLLDPDVDPTPLLALAEKVPGFVVLRQSSRPIISDDLTSNWGETATELFREGSHLADGVITSWHFHPGFVVTDNSELLGLDQPNRARTPDEARGWLESRVADEVRARALRTKWERASGKKSSQTAPKTGA
jgi:excisionase family DNA binding protein